ncbi:MAG: motility associated factor glycosyltransferase family protein [Cyanobacteria bacterium SIG31]|nr:motility associated factor glycosyltransferase family protein [Cyanobacteria bacterium SIG31]
MLDKNLEHIDNLALKRRLQKISSIESRIGISYCVTTSGDYVLLKDDVPADDLNNPREAVRKMLSNTIKTEMKSNDYIITFGIGLGYLLDEVYNKYSSKIYIYEPDLNLLHFVLCNVDISEHLASGRVFITNDLEELISKLSNTFITKDKVEIVYLQNYAVVKNKELLMLTQKVFDTCKSKMIDVNTISKFSKKWLSNTLNNIGATNSGKAYLLSQLENKYIGQTALIAAAGPSLDDNIQKIQANRDKFIVFAVNKVVRYLIQNGITPDFVVCLDAENMERTLGGLENHLERSNCIMDVRADSALFQKGFNKVFLSFTSTDSLSEKLANYDNPLRFYNSGGSASTLALVAAVKMGFSKIVFAGLDLAFKDNIIYSTGESMNRISQEQIIVDKVKKNLVQVKSVNNGNVYTREDYAAYIYHFEKLLKDLNYSEAYNISSFGAHIAGFKNVQFDDIQLVTTSSMQPTVFVEPIKFNIKDFMQDEFKEINNIISLLSKGGFSPALVSAIVKSALIYQCMQADVLKVLQKNFEAELAENFIEKVKSSIKYVVELLQKNKLI